MKKSFSIAALLFSFPLIVMVSSCARKGCTDINSSNYDPKAVIDDGSCTMNPVFQIDFQSRFGMAPLRLDSIMTFPDGRKISLSIAQFYVSNIIAEGSENKAFGNYFLLVKGNEVMYSLDHITVGDYSGVSFDVGLDSLTNHSDPSTYTTDHVLSFQDPPMHWDWTAGYQFIKVEGLVDTTAAGTGDADFPFEIHIGMDMLRRRVTVNKPISVTSGGDDPVIIPIVVDWLSFFQGIDWHTNNTTHTMDNLPMAETIAGNLEDVFKPGM